MRSGWAHLISALPLVGVVAFSLMANGCTKPPLTDEQFADLEAQAKGLANIFVVRPAGAMSGVTVQLAMGAEADLDLYVTDPLLDTVYFARQESRTGGVIGSDVRCDTEGPRIEEVRFVSPWPGSYRVGVDHPRRCDGKRSPAPAPYAVTVHANGKTYTANGIVELEFFEAIVLEFEVEDGGY